MEHKYQWSVPTCTRVSKNILSCLRPVSYTHLHTSVVTFLQSPFSFSSLRTLLYERIKCTHLCTQMRDVWVYERAHVRSTDLLSFLPLQTPTKFIIFLTILCNRYKYHRTKDGSKVDWLPRALYGAGWTLETFVFYVIWKNQLEWQVDYCRLRPEQAVATLTAK